VMVRLPKQNRASVFWATTNVSTESIL
jgi:hypothetical protein